MGEAAEVALAATEHREGGAPALASTLAALTGHAEDAAPQQAVPSGPERFVVRAVLGQGGMGRVHDAEDLQFGRRVALKELTGQGPELERRFAVEAIVTGNLEHPGIPAVYERGVRDGRAFYAMKKLSGRSLAEVIARTGALGDRLALVPLAIQVAHTLGFAHERGIVHRDVKPENVMIGGHGEVWVVDWGIAKVRGREDRPSDVARAAGDVGGATIHGSVMGTPAYMAPEQARGDVAAVDERTDVFALGALLYHLLSGRAPFEGATSVAVLAAALESRRPRLRAVAPEVPEALAEIVERAMAKEPRDRYPDAAAVALALERFVASAALARPSLAVRATAALASLGALALALVGTVMMVHNVASLREQGPSGYGVVLLAVLGLGLSVVEWRTDGRHALLPVSIAIAAASFIGGVAGTQVAYGLIARHALDGVPQEAWPSFLVEGLWEASGSGAMSAQLAVVQVIVIGLVARATRSREAGRAPARAP